MTPFRHLWKVMLYTPMMINFFSSDISLSFNDLCVWWIKFTDLKIIRPCSKIIHITRVFIINICCEALVNVVFFALILFELVLHVFPQNNLTAFFVVSSLEIIFHCFRFSNASFRILFYLQKADLIWFWWKFIFTSGNFRIIGIYYFWW